MLNQISWMETAFLSGESILFGILRMWASVYSENISVLIWFDRKAQIAVWFILARIRIKNWDISKTAFSPAPSMVAVDLILYIIFGQQFSYPCIIYAAKPHQLHKGTRGESFTFDETFYGV